MIRIREKDILFIAINLVVFFSYCSFLLMEKATLVGASIISTSYPNMIEGIIYLYWSFSGILIIIAGLITFFVDCWWIYRFIRELQTGYWKENL